MRELLWSMLAWVVSRTLIAAFIIRRKKDPFMIGQHGGGWWLFNGYRRNSPGHWPIAPCADASRMFLRFPSIGLTRWGSPDPMAELHDVPCHVREVVLMGWQQIEVLDAGRSTRNYLRGECFVTRPNHFHRITKVANEGCWSLIICGRFECDWGLLVKGRKMSYRSYLTSD